MTADDSAGTWPDRFVVHADLSGRGFGAAFLVLAGLAVAGIAGTGVLVGSTTLAAATTIAGAVAGLAVLAGAFGLAAGALWFGRTEGPELLAGAVRRRDVVLSVGADGVTLGTGQALPWTEVRELVVTEADVGDAAGRPEFVPCLAVVPVTGRVLPEVSLDGFRGDRDVVAALEPVVRRHAPQVPVTDRRRRSTIR